MTAIRRYLLHENTILSGIILFSEGNDKWEKTNTQDQTKKRDETGEATNSILHVRSETAQQIYPSFDLWKENFRTKLRERGFLVEISKNEGRSYEKWWARNKSLSIEGTRDYPTYLTFICTIKQTFMLLYIPDDECGSDENQKGAMRQDV